MVPILVVVPTIVTILMLLPWVMAGLRGGHVVDVHRDGMLLVRSLFRRTVMMMVMMMVRTRLITNHHRGVRVVRLHLNGRTTLRNPRSLFGILERLMVGRHMLLLLLLLLSMIVTIVLYIRLLCLPSRSTVWYR